MTTPATGLSGALIVPEGINVIDCSCKESFRGSLYRTGRPWIRTAFAVTYQFSERSGAPKYPT
jgi:hypothetical protein